MQIFTASPESPAQEKLFVWKRAGDLCALDLRGYETRNPSVLKLIALAEQTSELPAFGPLLVHTGDRPINTGDPTWHSLAFSSAVGFFDTAVPDFLFDGWPQVGLGDYEDAARSAAAAGMLEPETMRLGWIGNCDTHPSRWRLHELGAAHPDLLDVHHITWVPNADGSPMATLAGNQLSLEDQVRRWGLLIDIEGNGWSARLKLLLHSGRPVFIQERPWREWFWPQLRPMEHYIPVQRDLSDLCDRVRWALDHADEAGAIGQAGQRFAQSELTREAAARAWSRTLTELTWRPAPHYGPPEWRQLLDPVFAQLGVQTSATVAS